MAESITTQRQSRAARIARYWMPVLLMIGLMYWFSSDTFSGDNTQSILDSLLKWLVSGMSREDARFVNYIVRKSAHFVEYAFLALLLYRAFRQDSQRVWDWRWAIYSLSLLSVWAFLDEYRQSLTRTRGASVYDSLLDISGGIFALIVIALLGRWRDARSRKEFNRI